MHTTTERRLTPAAVPTVAELQQIIAEQQRRIAFLQWNRDLDMYSPAGLADAIERLACGSYLVVFCDIDKLKAINTATGSHAATNRYLRAGLQVRAGEICGQLYGDEIVFILAAGSDAPGFIERIGQQLAAQPLSEHERAVMVEAHGVPHLSATFAYADADAEAIRETIDALSADVMQQKAARDAAIRM